MKKKATLLGVIISGLVLISPAFPDFPSGTDSLKEMTAAQVKDLLTQGNDPNLVLWADTGQTWLMGLAENDPNADAIAALLKAGANANAVDKRGNTALLKAAQQTKNPDVIAALLDAGADAAQKDSMGLDANTWAHMNSSLIKSPVLKRLEAAAKTAGGGKGTSGGTSAAAAPKPAGKRFEDIVRKGTAAEVTAAIKAGANVNEEYMLGFTPLLVAASDNPDGGVILALLKAGADVKATLLGQNALHLAAPRFQDVSVVKALLKAGIDAAAFDDAGHNALFDTAAKTKNPAVIQTLLDAGADPSVKDLSGYTAFDQAVNNPVLLGTSSYWKLLDASGQSFCDIAAKRNAKIVQLSISHGADLKATNSKGMTPLMAAVASNRDPLVIDALLKAKADVKAVDPSKRNVLHIALSSHDQTLAVVAALIKAGADINEADADGLTPLMLLPEYSHIKELIPVLLKAGAKVNAKDAKGMTPLMHLAAVRTSDANASSEFAGYLTPLIKAGADVNARDNTGMTALLWAARSSLVFDPVQKVLVKAGADSNAKDNEGSDIAAMIVQCKQSVGGR